MSDEAIREKSPFSSLDRRIYLTLVAGLTGLVVWLSLTLHRSSDQVAALQEQRDLAVVKVALAVPAEVLYCDEATVRELALIRKRNFEQNGVEKFIPYAFIVDAGSAMEEFSLDDDRVAMPVDDLAVVERGILEASWVRTVVATCDTLVLEKQEQQGAGHYLAENPEAFEKQIRPCLERLTTSSRPMLVVAAAKALLEWDPNSAVARSALASLEARSADLGPEARERLKQLLPRVGGE